MSIAAQNTARLLRAALNVAGVILAGTAGLAATGPLASGTPHSMGAVQPSSGPLELSAVARIEVLVPQEEAFLLRATLPLPRDFEGTSPPRLGVRSQGRPPRIVPAQVETVSRSPLGVPQVVEILARVERPRNAQPHDPVRFDVFHLEGTHAAEVQLSPAPRVPAGVDELLDPTLPGQIQLRTTDVHGNVYTTDLHGHEGPGFGSRREIDSGHFRRRRRVYGTLVPSGPEAGDGAPLPHLMGAHAYLTEWAGLPMVGLDLRVNNGAIRGSRKPHVLETTLGIVYWKSLELVLPLGWTVVPKVRDPFLGKPRVEDGHVVVPLVKANADGTLHMMPPQAQLHRRLMVVPAQDETNANPRPDVAAQARTELDRENLGFCVRDRRNELWSWFNPESTGYFPQRDTLASFDAFRVDDLRGRYAARVREARESLALRAGLEEGVPRGWYVEAEAMGWAHPWFIRHAYGFGGEGIRMFEGQRVAASSSQKGFVYLELLHRMNACRQPETAYDRHGDPVGYHAWLNGEGKIPFDFRTHGGVIMPPFRLTMSWGDAPNPHVRTVVERGLRPAYDQGTPFERDGKVPDRQDNLFSWWPHDDAHIVRYTKNTKALVWLGNDALAKDDLLLSAELFRLMFHESEHIPASWSPGITLRVLEGIAAKHPHEGVHMGRAHGWGIDAMAATYSLADDAWRERNLEWFRRLGRLAVSAAMPSGLIQRMINERLFEARYTSTQVFESLFLIHGLRCAIESALRGVDDGLCEELERTTLRAIEYLYWGPPFSRMPASWQPDPSNPTIFYQGPRNYIAVSENDHYKTPVFSNADHWGANYLPADGLESGPELFHCWQALSYASQITGGNRGAGLENRYLRRALEVWIPHDDFTTLLADLFEQAGDPTYDNSPNWVGFAGRLQALGAR